MPGSATSATWRAVELEQRQPAVGVVEVDGRQPIADEPNVLERVGRLRGSTSRSSVRIVDVDGDHPAERRVAVGEEVERAVDRRDVLVARIGRVEHRPHDRGLDAVREVGDVDAVLRVGAAPDVTTRSRPSSETSGSKPHSGWSGVAKTTGSSAGSAPRRW